MRHEDSCRQAAHLRSLVRVGRAVAYWSLEHAVTTLHDCWSGISWYRVTPSHARHLRSRVLDGDRDCSSPTPHVVHALQELWPTTSVYPDVQRWHTRSDVSVGAVLS